MAANKPVRWCALPPLRSGSVPTSHRWYVVRTVPGRERAVRDRLESAGFGTFLPMTIEERIKRRMRWGREFEEKRKKSVVAFPSYLFVCFDIDAPAWRWIPRIDEVREIMPISDQPRAVSSEFIFRLMVECYDRSEQQPEQVGIEAGSLVRVLNGPFTSFIGVCQRSTEERLNILLSLFGRDTAVDLAAADVEKVEH
jgi:transcriptional antiterminator NusG